MQAHALYNSVSARKPQDPHWTLKAFQLQQDYWGDECSMKYADQKEITARLAAQLQAIREQFRQEIAEVEVLVRTFEDDVIEPDIKRQFTTK